MRIILASCALACLLATSACGTTASGGTATDASSSTDTSGGDDTPSTSTCPTPQAPAGTVKAWTSFQAGGKTYKQNACPSGDPLLQGSWRLVDGKTEDPATPFSDGTKEVLRFDGNTFTDHLAGPDNGQMADQVTSGWYWCGDASELTTKHHVLVIEKATPEDAFGNKSGDYYSAEFLSSGANQMALGLFSGFEGKGNGSYFYCRIGSTINGHCCNDPFAK